MAEGQITGQQLIADDVLPRIEKLNLELKETVAVLGKVETAARKAFNIEDLTRRVTELEKATDRSNAALKERERLQKAVIRQQARNEQLLSKTNQELVKQRVITQEQTRNLKRQETANNALVGSYRRLSAQLNIAKETYKDLAVEQGKNSTAARKQQEEVLRLQRRVRQADQAVGDFQRNVGNYPTALRPAITAIRQLIGAFGLIEGFRVVRDLIQDSIQLAREARGVEFAFERLGDAGVQAFNDIKQATRGALSDLDIQTALNEFDNFNIALEEAGVLFEFLTVRSRQTGRSIEDLQSSLVEGLSKESRLRIDNLGISVVALNEELEKTPDFVEAVANIARAELAEAGNIIDEAANSQERLTASLENAKVSFGQLLQSTNLGFLGSLADQIDRVNVAFQSVEEALGKVRLGLRNFFAPINDLIDRFPRLRRFVDNAGESISVFIDLITTPGIQAFADLLTQIGAIASGVGSAFSAATDATADFLNNLRLLTEIEFSLDPFETIASARGVFSRIGNGIRQGGEQVGEAFMEGYRSVIDFEPEEGEIKAPIEQLGNALDETRPKVAKVVDEIERGYRAAENLLKAFQQTFDITPEDLIASISQDELTAGLEALAERFKGLEDDALSSSERLAEIYQGVFDNFSRQYGLDLSAFTALLEQKTLSFDDYANTVDSISDSIYAGQIRRYEEDIRRNQEYLNTVLNDERATEEQKAIAREQARKREAELRLEQAKAEREATLIRIAVDTAQGIVSAFAQVPKFDFGISAAALAATIGAIGAAQAAFVASQPLPQFFKGKGLTDHYQGLATWGEKGREVRITESGLVEVSPSTTTPTYVHKDDLILKNIPIFQRQIQDPSSEVYRRVSRAWKTDTKERQGLLTPPGFNGAAIEKTIDRGLKKGFKGVQHKINIINRYPRQRLTRY